MNLDNLPYSLDYLFTTLPEKIDTKKDEPFNLFQFHLTKRNGYYFVNYYCENNKFDKDNPFIGTALIQEMIFDKSIALALTKLVSLLREKGMIE